MENYLYKINDDKTITKHKIKSIGIEAIDLLNGDKFLHNYIVEFNGYYNNEVDVNESDINNCFYENALSPFSYWYYSEREAKKALFNPQIYEEIHEGF